MIDKNQTFIEIKDGNDDAAKGEWLDHCRAEEIPYIVIVVQGKYASVAWDYISYPMGSELKFTKNEEQIVKNMKAIYMNYANDKSDYAVSASTSTFNKFPLENARAAAFDIYNLINNLMKT